MNIPITWLIIYVILIILLAITFYIILTQRIYLIDASNCPQIKSDYAVIPSKIGTTLKSCGVNNNDECISIQNTLEDAINLCNIRNDICHVFSYNPYSAEMIILQNDGIYTTNNSSNIYIKQIN